MPYLIELFLPLADPRRRGFDSSKFERIRAELTDRFGGLTAYVRAPAQGLWKPARGRVVRDDVVIYEVMADRLDRVWWRNYRKALEREFDQDELVVRATPFTRL